MLRRLILGFVGDENEFHCVYVVVNCKKKKRIFCGLTITLCVFEEFAVNIIGFLVNKLTSFLLTSLLFVNYLLTGIALRQLIIRSNWYHFVDD